MAIIRCLRCLRDTFNSCEKVEFLSIYRGPGRAGLLCPSGAGNLEEWNDNLGSHDRHMYGLPLAMIDECPTIYMLSERRTGFMRHRLIQSDPELEWSSSDYVEIKQERGFGRFYLIAWNGRSCFLWSEDQITCATPDEPQVAKLIGIAERLKANVVGDDGEQYTLSRSLFGKHKIKIVQP